MKQLFLALAFVGICYGQYYGQPEQIHISYGANPTDMMVTWTTLVNVTDSFVEYGINKLNLVAKGNVSKFIDGGVLHRVEWIHTVVLTALIPGKKYLYHVGSNSKGWSSLYSFTAMQSGGSWSPSFAVFGDMGTGNAESLPYLQEEAQKGGIHAVLHTGDFAYDLNNNNGTNGDIFMNQIQSIAAYIPYMTCVGNHEFAYNFSHYKYRFQQNKMFSSFNIASAHIISVNTEAYMSGELANVTAVTQYHWLIRDLQQANKERMIRPWIIVVGHRPMYCSSKDGFNEHSRNPQNPIRKGLNSKTRAYSLEDLFYKYGVDLQFYAHEHNYERLWPVYREKVCNGTKEAYINPGAPVHIVTGSGGNQEYQTKFMDNPYAYSAFRSMDYGYTKMTIHNSTHLSLQQVSVTKGGAIIDKATIIKQKHGPGIFNCS